VNFSELLQRECPELVQQQKQGESPTDLIRATLDELDRAGSWSDSPPLHDNEQRRAAELENTVDAAALAGDLAALQKALAGYKSFWLPRREPRQGLLFGGAQQ
jgi:hypothetical protein